MAPPPPPHLLYPLFLCQHLARLTVFRAALNGAKLSSRITTLRLWNVHCRRYPLFVCSSLRHTSQAEHLPGGTDEQHAKFATIYGVPSEIRTEQLPSMARGSPVGRYQGCWSGRSARTHNSVRVGVRHQSAGRVNRSEMQQNKGRRKLRTPFFIH